MEAAAQFQKGLDQLALLPDDRERQRQELEFYSSLSAALRAAKGQAAPETGQAYARALELAPSHPAPHFFLGLALARSGDREGALAQWQPILATAPANASWRPLIESGIAMLDQKR